MGQYASRLSNWTVRAITRALKWLFFTASKKKRNFFCFDFKKEPYISQILLKLWLIVNRTSCRPIQSVTILVMKQIGLILLITRMITDRIELHSVLRWPATVTAKPKTSRQKQNISRQNRKPWVFWFCRDSCGPPYSPVTIVLIKRAPVDWSEVYCTSGIRLNSKLVPVYYQENGHGLLTSYLLKIVRVALAFLYPRLLVATQVYFPLSLFWLMLIRREPLDIFRYRGLLWKLIGTSFFCHDIEGVGVPRPTHFNSTVSLIKAWVFLGGTSIHTSKAEIKHTVATN